MDTQNYDESGAEDDIQTSRKQIHQSITRYLAQREHGFNEIISKLVQKGYLASLSREVLEGFRDNDWQSDVRYAELLIKRRIDRGYGSQFIIAECRSKGLNGNLIQQIMATLDVDWSVLAAEVVVRKFGKNPPKDTKALLKRQNFLGNRGFRMDEIRSVYGK